MPLTHDQIADFTKATISKFHKRKWVDLSLDLTSYPSSQLITREKLVEWGGDAIKFDAQYRNLGNARAAGLFSQDVLADRDQLIQGSVGWTKQTCNYIYDIDMHEFQGGPETIVPLLTMKEHSCHNDIAVLREQQLWGQPSSTTDAQQTPYGIPFWIKKDATTTVGGAFNGGNPTGFSAGAAGIDSSTYAAWKNWTFGYTTPDIADLVAKVKKAMVFTEFEAPHPHAELGFGKSDYNIFTTYRVVEPLERLAETRNDNLGKDLAKYVGQVTIGGVPMKMVHYLENNDTSDPLYGVNWKYFRPYVKRGCDMRKTGPERVAGQHTVYAVFFDTWMNYICVNRRAQWVGSKS